MPTIQSFMKRLGFVKLRDFGLVLTPEGRIQSIRPAILDDGTGGRIVGWRDDDVAELQLARWPHMASLPAVASSVAVPPRPIPVAKPVVVAPIPSLPQPPVIRRPTPGAVASEGVVDEDDWEWTIAMARARATADDDGGRVASGANQPDLAVPSTVTPIAATPPPIPPRRMRSDTVPPAVKVTAARTRVATPPVPLKPFDTSDNSAKHAVPTLAKRPAFIDPITVVEAAPPTIAAPIAQPTPVAKPTAIPRVVAPVAREFPRAGSPQTIIPVPKLPKAAEANSTRIAPVVRKPTGAVPTVTAAPAPVAVPKLPTSVPNIVPIPPAQPRRFAKGTGPHAPTPTRAPLPSITTRTAPAVVAQAAPAPAIAAQLAVGDETLPGLILPAALRR